SNAGSFRCDQGLESDGRQKIRFRDLPFDYGSADVEHGLTCVEHRSFGHGEHIAREAERGEGIPEALRSFAKALKAAQVGDLVWLEAEIQQVIDCPMDAGEQHEVPVARQTANRKLERPNVGLTARGKITRGHREFVEIREKAVQAVTSFLGGQAIAS